MGHCSCAGQEQPTGAGLGGIAGHAPTAAHHCAMQSPCWDYTGAAGVLSHHVIAQPSSCWPGWTGQPGSASDTMPQLGSASHPPAHPNLPSHHCSGCWTCSQGPSLSPTAQGQWGHALGWAMPLARLHSLPWAAHSCPGLSDPDMASGSCSCSVLEGFRSGHPSVGEEGTPFLCTSA